MERTMVTGYLMSESEVKRAYRICDEFGPRFDGIKDRVDAVTWALTHGTFGELERASEELLTSVNPIVARRIAPVWKGAA